PAFGVNDALTISQPNFTLRHVQVALVGGNVTFEAAATGARILDCIVVNYFKVPGSTGAIQLNSSRTLLGNSTILSAAGTVLSDVIRVNPVSGANNVINGNTIGSASDQPMVEYVPVRVTTGDQITNNTFLGDAFSGQLLRVGAFVDGLTIRGNTFQDDENDDTGIGVNALPTNINIVNNRITLSGASGLRGITIGVETAGATTSATVALNEISTKGVGVGLEITAGAPLSALNVKVEGNDFHGNGIGVFFLPGTGGSITGVAPGGGARSSRGANNFRGFTAAGAFSGATAVSTDSS